MGTALQQQILARTSSKTGSEFLWEFDYPSLVTEFKAVSVDIGCPGMVPYQLRHAGPSWDALKRLRTETEIQSRGRWKSAASMKRYRKHGRVSAEFARLSTETRVYHEQCSKVVGDVLCGLKPAPDPPLHVQEKLS
eukprot:10686239-Karenia_brevis.AAC.1